MLSGGPSAGVKRSLVDRTRPDVVHTATERCLFKRWKIALVGSVVSTASGYIRINLFTVFQVLEGIAGVVDIQCIK